MASLTFIRRLNNLLDTDLSDHELAELMVTAAKPVLHEAAANPTKPIALGLDHGPMEFMFALFGWDVLPKPMKNALVTQVRQALK